MATIFLSNGIELYDNNDSAKLLQKYALDKGLKSARVFLSNDRGRLSFLLTLGESPEFESQQVEAVAAHIDALVLFA